MDTPHHWPKIRPTNETPVRSLSRTWWSKWCICSALKGFTFFNVHRIGMFRDIERSYRTSWGEWYKSRSSVYIWALAWNNTPDGGRPEWEHPTSGWMDGDQLNAFTTWLHLIVIHIFFLLLTMDYPFLKSYISVAAEDQYTVVLLCPWVRPLILFAPSVCVNLSMCVHVCVNGSLMWSTMVTVNVESYRKITISF